MYFPFLPCLLWNKSLHRLFYKFWFRICKLCLRPQRKQRNQIVFFVFLNFIARKTNKNHSLWFLLIKFLNKTLSNYLEIFLKLIEWIELFLSQATFKYPNPWSSSANQSAVSATTSGATQSNCGQNPFQNSSFVVESPTNSAQHLWIDILNVSVT